MFLITVLSTNLVGASEDTYVSTAGTIDRYQSSDLTPNDSITPTSYSNIVIRDISIGISSSRDGHWVSTKILNKFIGQEKLVEVNIIVFEMVGENYNKEDTTICDKTFTLTLKGLESETVWTNVDDFNLDFDWHMVVVVIIVNDANDKDIIYDAQAGFGIYHDNLNMGVMLSVWAFLDQDLDELDSFEAETSTVTSDSVSSKSLR